MDKKEKKILLAVIAVLAVVIIWLLYGGKKQASQIVQAMRDAFTLPSVTAPQLPALEPSVYNLPSLGTGHINGEKCNLCLSIMKAPAAQKSPLNMKPSIYSATAAAVNWGNMGGNPPRQFPV